MSSILEITKQDQWDAHLAALPASTLLIVSFHAPWAAPCAQMKTALATLATEYPVTDPATTSWVSVNAEELSDLSEQFNVTAVPFLVLLRDGEVVESVSGSQVPKVRAAIEKQAKTSTATATAPGAGQGHAEGQNGKPAGADTVQEGVSAEQDGASQKTELFSRIATLVKAAPVMLFMKGSPSAPQCGFSRQMVALLRERSVKYGFFNILADDEVRQGLKEYADWPTFPQLWVDGELIGGLDIVKEEIASNGEFLKTHSMNNVAEVGA